MPSQVVRAVLAAVVLTTGATLAPPAVAAKPGHHREYRAVRHPPAHPDRRRLAIIGGHTAAAGSWPWVAFVSRLAETGTRFRCTGTVVSPTVVLTAAHCAEDLVTGVPHLPSAYTVVTGRLDVSDPSTGQALGVSQVIVNPAFNASTLSGDAALLVLAAPTTTPAIRLAATEDSGLLASGTLGSIAGWGSTDAAGTVIPSALQSGAIAIQSAPYCTSQLGTRFHPESMICAIDAPAHIVGTCHGDSGGPVLARRADATWVEVGMTSWSLPGCPTASPSAFVRIDAVSAWVTSVLLALTPPPAPAPAEVAPVAPPPAPQPPQPPAPPAAPPANPGVTPGRYTGRSSQDRPVRLWISGDGFRISAFTLDYTLRCERRRRRLPMRVTVLSPGDPWSLTGRTFARRFVGNGHVTYHVAGVVRSTRLITVALRASVRTPRYGSCSSGRIMVRALRR